MLLCYRNIFVAYPVHQIALVDVVFIGQSLPFPEQFFVPVKILGIVPKSG